MEGNVEMRWIKEEEEGRDRRLIRAEKREKTERGDGGPGGIKAKCRKDMHQEEGEKEEVRGRSGGRREENSEVDGRKDRFLLEREEALDKGEQEKSSEDVVRNIEEMLNFLRQESDENKLCKKVKAEEEDKVDNREKEKGERKRRILNGDIRTWLEEGSLNREQPNSKSSMSKDVQKKGDRTLQETKLVNIREGPGNEVLVKNNLWLTRTDFRSLADNNYLNDKIIDEYLTLIQMRNSKDHTLPEIATFTVFLYHKLERLGLEEGYRDTETWIKEDIREKDMVFFPIHKDHHSSLVVIEMKTKTIHYLDSISGSRRISAAPRTMKKYMEKYYKTKGEVTTFKINIRENIPCQTNGVDCGVFLCQYAERLARKAPIDFKQEDMEEIRGKMTEELLKSELFKNKSEGTQATVKTVKGKAKKEVSGGKQKGVIHMMETSKKAKRATEGSRQKETSTGRQAGQESKDTKGIGKNNKRGGKKEIQENRKQPGLEFKDSKKEGKDKMTEDKRKERIKWPKANSPEWQKLDEDLTSILGALHSSPEEKAESHPKLIYAFCKERFGVIEKGGKKPQPGGPSRRQIKGKKLRQEINKLKKAYEQAPAEEKDAINQLQQEKLKELRLAKRVETLKRNRKKFTKNCSAFLGQPFEFGREVVAPKPRGEIHSSKQEVQGHLYKAHSDPSREEERKIQEDLWVYQEPKVEFNNELPTWSEVSKRLRKTRSKSAPGPNGVPYLVYKRCQGLARLLWQYLRGIWRKNGISKSWRNAEGIFIPKDNGATSVEKFRTVSLLNVEGKLYFAIKADRLLKFILTNDYIDTSIQKGGVPAVSGCLEHTAVLSQLIREAKAGRGNLVVTWLDIANAYGSIPHNVIQVALNRAHVPESMCSLVKSYYGDVKIRFTTKHFTTEWQRVEKGIITGCTMSVVLFSLTMTMLVMSAKEETKGPNVSSGQRQVNCRLFMDDIATTTETLVQTRYLLQKLAEKLNWAELTVKPEKCRSLVITKGRISKRTPEINGEAIMSITEKPVRYLGKSYNMSLNEQEQITEAMKQAKEELKKIEKCKLPGRYKGWILQHILLPRLMWPLSIYNVPMTKVEEIQRQITISLRRWLGIPRSWSADCLYTKSGKLQLPFTALTEEVRAAKARMLITFRESSDPRVRGAKIKVDGGRKANTPPADVEDAKSKLRMREIAGIANRGREGPGLNPRQYYSSSSKKEKRDMIVSTVRETEKEKRRIRMAGLAKQGANIRWEVPERRLSHRDVINASETSLKFLIKSVYDLLPTQQTKTCGLTQLRHANYVKVWALLTTYFLDVK